MPSATPIRYEASPKRVRVMFNDTTVADSIERRLAFYWNRVDRWLEEDEEVFGHPRDPYHRVDVRASAREISVTVAGERIATTRRALFMFETGLPTRYYIPPDDVRAGALVPSSRRTVCPYKGQATHWSLRLGDRVVEDAAWSYLNPLPECARIGAYFCFDPQKAERIDVEL